VSQIKLTNFCWNLTSNLIIIEIPMMIYILLEDEKSVCDIYTFVGVCIESKVMKEFGHLICCVEHH